MVLKFIFLLHILDHVMEMYLRITVYDSAN